MPARSHASGDAEPGPVPGERFDADYYRRFYVDRRTRVSDLAAVRKLVAFVAGYLGFLGVPVRSMLDVGCGLGHWRTAARTAWPRARYHGLECSGELCARFGWTRGSVVDLDATTLRRDGTFDLIVCRGVLQYLDDRDAARAIDNLGRWCGGALYLEALTTLDWRENCDQSRTDGAVHLRSGAWYRRRLGKHFVDCGGGVFCSRNARVTWFELEARP
jgi:SAM-dependent methyltransferase